MLGISNVSSQIISLYNLNSKILAETLTKISSGKKFQNASEDLVSFLKAQKISSDLKSYKDVKENLTDFKTYTSTAVSVGSEIYETLLDMRELASKYGNTTDPDLKAEYKAEFDALAKKVQSALDNTYVDGVKITTVGNIKTANLNPNGNNSITMNFTDIASNVESLDITDPGAVSNVQSKINSMLIYLSEAKAYNSIADQHLNLIDNIINSKETVLSIITDIDDAEETA
ncbi:MAG: hypothetical protein N2053_10195, partial [Chitinispirillaceae bacterium]|nr:hypothetical protein [Chitinispirillaceae bacterium]